MQIFQMDNSSIYEIDLVSNKNHSLIAVTTLEAQINNSSVYNINVNVNYLEYYMYYGDEGYGP